MLSFWRDWTLNVVSLTGDNVISIDWLLRLHFDSITCCHPNSPTNAFIHRYYCLVGQFAVENLNTMFWEDLASGRFTWETLLTTGMINFENVGAYTFQRLIWLVIYVATTQSIQPDFACNLCNKLCRSARGLTWHYKWQHHHTIRPFFILLMLGSQLSCLFGKCPGHLMLALIWVTTDIH